MKQEPYPVRGENPIPSGTGEANVGTTQLRSTPRMNTAAYLAGMSAARRGDALSANPYKGALSFTWLQGYQAGRQ